MLSTDKTGFFSKKKTTRQAMLKAQIASFGEYLKYGISHNEKNQVIVLSSSYEPYLPHQKILDAGANAWYSEQLKYYSSKSSEGAPVLQESVTKYFEKKGVKGSLVVGTSIIHDLLKNLFRNVIKENEIIITTVPFYSPIFMLISEYNCKASLIDLTLATKFRLTSDALRLHLQQEPNATAYLFVNPDNPTGVAYAEEELFEFAKIFVEHNRQRKVQGLKPLIIVADEITGNVILSPTLKFHHLASMPGMQEFTYTVTALSKDQAPIGVAIGWGPDWLVKNLHCGGGRTYPSSAPGYTLQAAAAVAFDPVNENEMHEHHQKNIAFYLENLRLVKTLIQQTNEKIACIQTAIKIVQEPEAGFQLLIKMTGLMNREFPAEYEPVTKNHGAITCSLDLAWYLRSEGKVELMPGEGFGIDQQEMIFRMTMSVNPEALVAAFNNIAKCILALKQPQLVADKTAEDALHLRASL
jgi:aspartate/methionine/tyrosine aminotransferase